jgi:predicted nucleic acid-binding Zn ribbon protein
VRPLSHALPGALRLLLHDLPLSNGKVEFAWTAAVGPAVARATAVKLEHGVLIVETTSPQWTLEIRRSSPVILKRLQSLLGDDAINSITVRT